MAAAPDGRIFLTEKYGRILIIENGQVQTDPFLEIAVDNFNERGLSGIAIDPDFASNGYVYVYYTVPGANHNRISRFTADGGFAAPNSEFILMELDSLSGPHHNAGAMDFGPDGKLYVATGDGFSTDVSQDLNSVLGKILRLNPDGTIPGDNPFFDQLTGKARAIWATGFRNPFAMCLETGTGRLFATDVGSHKFEEINEIFKGKNYGWPLTEGLLGGGTPPPDYVEPLLAYNHLDACAATGVEIYAPQNPMFPAEFFGKLFYSDYCSGNISTIDLSTGEEEVFASQINRPLNLLTAPDGTMYYIARGGLEGGSSTANTASSNGELWRIFYTGSDAPFIAVQPKSILVSVGENAAFETVASGVEPLNFQWQKNGVDLPGATFAEYIFENPTLSDSGSVVRCIVTNPEGADTTQLAEIQVTTSQRPIVEILEPTDGTTYRAGDALVFRGQATDPEEGELTAENFRWKIDFHHNEHTHPALGPISGIAGDTLRIPKAGEVSDNVWFRINFTVTDDSGLSKTEQRLVFPEKSNFTVKTQPPGLPIETNGGISATPYVVPSVVGVLHQMKAPFMQLSGDSLYTFEAWSTGDSSNPYIFDAPENDVTVTAIYRTEKALSDGQGLQAFYFDDPTEASEFTQPFAFSQIDPQVNFDWANGSPNLEELGKDYYLIRWEGYVQPLTSGTINFHVISDDGSRLWVNDELIIDQWVGQARTEHTGEILLEAGEFYPIRLEYFERVGDAVVQLLWSGEELERGFVPSSQLFPKMPKDTFEGEGILVKYFPNPVADFLNLELFLPSEMQVKFELFNPAGQMFFTEKTNLPEGFSQKSIDLREVARGVYFLRLEWEGDSQVIEIFK